MIMAEGGDCLSLEGVCEELIYQKTSGKADAQFDNIVGAIQDILFEDGLSELQREFFDKHYHHFDDVEENKFIYTDIFKEYTKLVEAYLERELKERQPGFEMGKFMKSLESRKNEIGDEILDMLQSFTDFVTFKETILDYKAEKEGRGLTLGCGLSLDVTNSTH